MPLPRCEGSFKPSFEVKNRVLWSLGGWGFGCICASWRCRTKGKEAILGWFPAVETFDS